MAAPDFDLKKMANLVDREPSLKKLVDKLVSLGTYRDDALETVFNSEVIGDAAMEKEYMEHQEADSAPKDFVKSGEYKGHKWYIVQTNSGNLSSPVDYQMVVPGFFKSDYFRSLEGWSVNREVKQAKSFIDDHLKGESFMKKFVTREVMENLIKGSYEQWLEVVDEAVETYNAKLTRVATFGPHVIVKNEAADFFRLHLHDGKVVSEEKYHVPTLDENEVVGLLKGESKKVVRNMLEGKPADVADVLDLMENGANMKKWLWQRVGERIEELGESFKQFSKTPFAEQATKTTKPASLKEMIERARYFMSVIEKYSMNKNPIAEQLAGPIVPIFTSVIGNLSTAVEKASEVDSLTSPQATEAFTALANKWYDVELVGLGLEKLFKPGV